MTTGACSVGSDAHSNARYFWRSTDALDGEGEGGGGASDDSDDDSDDDESDARSVLLLHEDDKDDDKGDDDDEGGVEPPPVVVAGEKEASDSEKDASHSEKDASDADSEWDEGRSATNRVGEHRFQTDFDQQQSAFGAETHCDQGVGREGWSREETLTKVRLASDG